MLDSIVAATPADLETLWQLYADVCAQQEHDAYTPQWTQGVYPTIDDLRAHVDAGDMYVGTLDGRFVAAMVLTPHEDPEYLDVPWPTACAQDEVAVIHLLAVHPSMRGKHLGAELVREAIALARKDGKRVIHLDVVPGNLAASRIYRDAGFVPVGTYQIFYEDTGLADFDMYERVL